MMTCPYCFGQGALWTVTIAGIDGTAVMCDECNTIWWHEQIVDGTGVFFDDFMKTKGLEVNWKKIVWVSMFDGS